MSSRFPTNLYADDEKVTSRFQSSGAAAISPVSSTLQKEYYAEHRNAYHAKNFKKMWKAAGKTKQVGNAAAKQWISEMREIDQKLDAFIRVLATNSRTSERTKRLLGSKTCVSRQTGDPVVVCLKKVLD
jgi:hypothetical protein